MFKLKKAFPGIYQYNQQYFTKNLLKDYSFPGESVLKVKNLYFREWKNLECKIASALPFLKEFPFARHSTFLCLGELSPVTISFLSDVIGIPGMILAVSPSAKMQHKLSQAMHHRKNILSILADYSNPENLEKDLSGFNMNGILQENETDSIASFVTVSNSYLSSGGKAVLIQKKTENVKEIVKDFKHSFNDVLMVELPTFNDFIWLSGVKK